MAGLTETLPGVGPREMRSGKTITGVEQTERAAVGGLVRAARARGEDLTGPEGLWKTVTATVLACAVAEEMSEHLGFEKYQGPEGCREYRSWHRAENGADRGCG